MVIVMAARAAVIDIIDFNMLADHISQIAPIHDPSITSTLSEGEQA